MFFVISKRKGGTNMDLNMDLQIILAMVLAAIGLVLAIIGILLLIQAKKEENSGYEYSIVFESEEELEKVLQILHARKIMTTKQS